MLTKATTKLKSLLDGSLVKKVLQGMPLGDEERWQEEVWLVPAVSILTRLCFRMEGITALVNGTFTFATTKKKFYNVGFYERKKWIVHTIKKRWRALRSTGLANKHTHVVC